MIDVSVNCSAPPLQGPPGDPGPPGEMGLPGLPVGLYMVNTMTFIWIFIFCP